MTPERWSRLKELFGEAAELDQAGQRALIERVASGDAALAEQLRALLAERTNPRLRPPLDPGPAPAATPARTFEAGYELGGRYRIDSFLGAGGMGEVYAALDRETGERVAIKVLHEGAAQPEYERRLTREMTLARRIPHQNICRVFDVQRAPGPRGAPLLFLTMELLEGETLSARIARGPVTAEEARQIAGQLCDGLACAHENGIIHRDLKDANVMLVSGAGGRARVVITDFGLAREQAKASPSATVTGATGIAGTVAYMAPEVLQEKPATTASDVYSLGVILFKLVTGQLPFEGETALAVALRRLRAEAPSPRRLAKGVDRRWERAIGACLAAAPERRPPSARDVRRILEGAPWRRPGSHRRVALVAAAALGLIALSAAITLLPRHAPPDEAVRHFRIAEEFVRRRSAEDIANAIQEYQQAIRIAPEYAEAWAGVADALAARANFGLGDTAESIAQARTAADRAVKLDSRSARAVGVLGYCLSVDVDHWLEAEPYFKRAVALDPKQPETRLWYGAFLGKTGHSREGIAQLRAGLQEEPASFALNHQLAAEYLRIGDTAQALASARELVRLQPYQGIGYLMVARVLETRGDYAAALTSCDKAAEYLKHPDVEAARASILAHLGRRDEAAAAAARLDAMWSQRRFESQMLARLYVALGEKARALAVLRVGRERKEASLVGSLLSPAYAPLFDEPEFQQLLRGIGLDPAILAAYKR